jgi:CheY-like chemotaxis protein
VIKPVENSLLFNTIAGVLSRGKSTPLAPLAPAVFSQISGAHLLLAEDNTINQLVARDFLTSLGVTCEVVENGQLAVTAVLANPDAYDCVLMDVQMPQVDGLEATRLIRQRVGSDRLPIIAMTACASDRERQHCLDAGMDDHVGKPFDPPALIGTLNRWVRPRVRTQPVVTPGLERDPRSQIHGLTELPPFDLTAALSRLSGNERLLRRIIRDFASMYGAGGQIIQRLAASADWPQIELFSHSLKSTAGILGAGKLAAAAERVEKACRDEQLAGIEPLLTALDAELVPAAAAAAMLPPSRDGSLELPDAQPAATFDPVATASIATDLRQLLERRSMKARKRFVEFRAAVTGQRADAQLEAMAIAVERLDNDEAVRLMDGIASTLGLGEAA